MATASQPIEQPILPPMVAPPECDNLSRTAIPTTASIMADYRAKYESLNQDIHALGGIIVHTLDEMIPLLVEMKSLLSRKSCTRSLKDGLPQWGDYLDGIAEEFGVSKRTIQRRLTHPDEGEEDDAGREDAKEENGEDNGEVGEPGEEPPEDTGTHDEPTTVVYESPKEQVTKWIKRQRKALSGGDGPADADPVRSAERRIDTGLQLLDEIQLAIDEGLLDPAPQVAQLRQEINKHDQSKLTVVPLHLRQANALVSALHRHHSPIRVAKFSIGASKEGRMVGAAICMRPASRALDDGRTIEVCRLVTDGTRDACSFLYGACARISRDMGYDKITTYILESEPGTSLKAAGWTLEKRECGGTPQGKRTNRPNGHEVTPVTFMKKQRWARLLQAQADKKEVSSAPVGPTEGEANAA